LAATVSHLQQELETMQSQLSHEVGNKGALETVLERSREESLQQRFSNEELTSEMQHLREQVVKLQQSQ
jgi:polyhydroxyalkanoate synthesis regulator phasin